MSHDPPQPTLRDNKRTCVLFPGHFEHWPQLALLSALDTTLLAMIHALVAAHPELRHPHLPSLASPLDDEPAVVADSIIDLADRLRFALSRYQRILGPWPARRVALEDHPEQDPFHDGIPY